MDFVSGLPKTRKRFDSIWVIEDQLTKSAHFLPVRVNYSLDRLAKLYINEIMKLHGILVGIISNCDLRFTLRFWNSLQQALETKLNFSMAFHPHLDG